MANLSNEEESFPLWLQEQLHKTGLTNGQLAKKLGVGRELVGKWLRGDVKKPQYENLVNLAEIFGNGKDDKELIDLLVNLIKNSDQQNRDTFKTDLKSSFIIIEATETTKTEEVINRSDELKILSTYGQKSRLILITGVSGIGKSFLINCFYNLQVKEKILYRCYHDTSIESIAEYVGLVLGHRLSTDPMEFIVRTLISNRCLLVLDNLDLEHQEYGESYHQLLERIAETPHQSCVIVTCRSLPKGYGSWEPNPKVLRLKGFTESEAISFLDNLGIPPKSDPELLKALFNKYGGNPLGLKLATQDILEKFKGDLAAYLKHSTLFAGNLHDEIQSIVDRLSSLGLEILYWLALQREPIYFGDILEEFPDRYKTSSRSTEIDKAVEELDRRSLLQSHDSEFCLQTEVQTCIEIRFLNAIQSELEEIAADGDVDRLHWLRALNLSDEKIKLRDRLLRRDPVLVAQAHSKLGVNFQQHPEKAIGHAIANFRYLLEKV